jgi:hypothetical protein
MADDPYADIIVQQHQRLVAEQAHAVAEMEAGRLSYDQNRVDQAADTILQIKTKLRELGDLANDHVARQQQAPQQIPYGLRAEHVEAAQTCGVSLEDYARGLQRYEAEKRAGFHQQRG